jgi:drug/metabolite transporter (DMT)-like permease
MTALTGQWEHASHNIPDMALSFTMVFAVVALAAFVPAFLILDRLPRRVGGSTTAFVVGTLLGVATCLAVAMTFRESEDPQDILGFIRPWTAHPDRFLLGAAPFMVAGASFGFFWTRARPEPSSVSQL